MTSPTTSEDQKRKVRRKKVKLYQVRRVYSYSIVSSAYSSLNTVSTNRLSIARPARKARQVPRTERQMCLKMKTGDRPTKIGIKANTSALGFSDMSRRTGRRNMSLDGKATVQETTLWIWRDYLSQRLIAGYWKRVRSEGPTNRTTNARPQ